MTTSTLPLHPILEAVVEELARDRATLLEAAARVPADRRAQAPAPGRWSAAQVLSHLVKVESSSGRLFSVHARRLREAGGPAESSTDAATVIDRFARFPLPSRARPVEAPEMVAPDDTMSFDDALLALAESRSRLLDAIGKANGLALGTVSAPHPRLGELTMYEWLLMIARHEVRHAAQLDEIATS